MIRPALLVVAVACCLAGLIREWPQVPPALANLHAGAIAGAAATALAGAASMMLSWRAVLADLGSPLPVGAAARVMFVSQLAKYVPGSVWAFAAQVELGRDYQVPRRRSASAVIISLAVTLAVGLLTATVALPLSEASAARHYWWALAIAPLIVGGLCPPVLGRLLDRGLLLLRQQPLDQRPTARGVLTAAAWAALGWLLWGLHSWMLVAGLTGRGTHVIGLAIGGYALAWSVGVLLIIFPGGIGPRELALIAALSPVMERADALVVALVSRIIMTATDAGWALIALVAGKRASVPGSSDGSPAPGGHRQPGRHRKAAPQPELPAATG